MGRKVVPPKIVFKQIGTPEDVERALSSVYNRIFTIAAQNIRDRREIERQDNSNAVKDKNADRKGS